MRGARGMFRHDLRILAYHRVLDLPQPDKFEFDVDLVSAGADEFRRQMQLVRDRFNPIGFDTVLDCLERGKPLPEDATLVTFDDGYDDNYAIAFPILRELGMSAMFFVSTGHIDSGMPYAYDWLVRMIVTTPAAELDATELGRRWDLPDSVAARRDVARELLDLMKSRTVATQQSLMERLQREWAMPPAPHPDCRPMNWEQLREMRSAGMEIGSHGVNHLMMSQLPPGDMAWEIGESRRRLEQQLGVPTQVLSYPVGGPTAFDDGVVSAARAAGYQLACSYMPGASACDDASRYEMRRIPIERDVDLPWFEALVAVPEVFAHPARILAT